MAFFQLFQAVLNPKSPVFVTTKAGEPLIAQRLTRPSKPRCLSAGPLRPPSAYRIRGSAARAPVRLRHGDVTRGTHHGFAIEGEAIAHDVFVGVGIVSFARPDLFPEPSVWSHLGQGYGYVPFVLPVVGLWWLARTQPAR